TKDPIHIYIISSHYRNRAMPLRFYVSTTYADGTPARCKVNVAVSNSSFDADLRKRQVLTRPVATVRTNRYGVAKVSGARIPREFEQEDNIDLKFSATDFRGHTGKDSEDIDLDRTYMAYVETDKTLYRAGEPITASITSSASDETLLVDL